ncbi:MAG TPA: FeoB-associated Cys-rich membrane protein [Geobacteraceae bacterium]
MGANDVVWMVVILGGAGWLLYHSLWKKKGSCHGCSGGCCDAEKKHKASHVQ